MLHGSKRRPRSASSGRAALGLVAIALFAAPIGAQRTPTAPGPARVQGIVLDALTGQRLVGARVQVDGMRGGTLTDSLGTFRLEAVELGVQEMTVEQYGFEGVVVQLEVRAAMPPVQIELQPRPVMLEGMSVVSDRLARMEARLRSRRRSVATSTRAFDLERLTRSASGDMMEFLRFESSLGFMSCGGRMISSLCVFRRGRMVSPAVFIDEVPAIGGLDQLATYRPHELYLVEVYGSGLQVRAYTHNFMERMARRPIALIPIVW